MNFVFWATAEHANADQEEEAEVNHQAELRRMAIERDAALVEATGPRNQVTKAGEDIDNLKSEVNLANESRAQLQRQGDQLNLAQDNDDNSRTVKFRKIADNVATVAEIAEVVIER